MPNRRALAAVVGLGALSLSAALRAQTLPNQLIGGQIQRTILSACYADRGFVTFQRNVSTAPAAGTKAVVSFPELVVGLDPLALNVGYDLSGQAVMTFSSATTGNIRFKQLPGLSDSFKNPAFGNYSESYNATARQLTVNFTIGFPNCSMPIVMILDAVT